MSTEKFEQIDKLFKEAAVLANIDLPEPVDYSSVKQRVMQLELRAELQLLTKFTLYKELVSFNKHFKLRCKQRFENKSECIGFQHEPSSPTNELYWHL